MDISRAILVCPQRKDHSIYCAVYLRAPQFMETQTYESIWTSRGLGFNM